MRRSRTIVYGKHTEARDGDKIRIMDSGVVDCAEIQLIAGLVIFDRHSYTYLPADRPG
jgi:hypothetical protein